MKKFKYKNLEFSLESKTGLGTLKLAEEVCLKAFSSQVFLDNGEVLNVSDFNEHQVKEEPLEDHYGKGTLVTICHRNEGDINELVQKICFYDNQTMTIQVIVNSSAILKTNRIDVLTTTEAPIIGQSKPNDLRFLAVPFDNDKWAKFVDYPLAYAPMSYEFTAIHPQNSQEGLVIGSVNHDTWKTGVSSHPLTVTAGVATELTRDLDGMAHGFVTGSSISSPGIFVGYHTDFQDGFLAFGKLNSIIKPPLKWTGDVPVGWNSWAALMGNLTYEKYQEASDYLATHQKTFCDKSGKQYINFDAGWNNFTPKMQEVKAYTKKNQQLSGSYLAPFIGISPFKGEVAALDGDYNYKDLLLKDQAGNVLPPIDGLYSYDPTHPGTLAQLKYDIERKKKWGFKFLKVDFLGHACREGVFYNQEITTGVQAYNYGMQYLLDCIGDSGIFLSLSIDPIFPHGYGHGRRISCDAFGSIDQSEYVNNSTTYLWWMNDLLYRFNDPDHLVLYKSSDMNSISFEEGKTRFNSGVICGGMMINSDDYHYEIARERGNRLFANSEINRIIQEGKTFRPVTGYQGQEAATVFIRKDEESRLIALFNYSLSDEKVIELDLPELFQEEEKAYVVRDLWSKQEQISTGHLTINLKPTESTIIKLIHN